VYLVHPEFLVFLEDLEHLVVLTAQVSSKKFHSTAIYYRWQRKYHLKMDLTENLVLLPSGFISIYNDAIHGGVFVYDNGDAGGAHYINIDHDASLPNAYYKHFTYQGTTVGSITRSGTTGVSYNTSSDYRLKENVVPVTNATDRVKQLNPCRFNFIGEARTVDGFLAHEAQAVVPESVTGDKDAVDSEGNPVYQGIDQSKLVPLLTAALQEALERIETLEATVNGGGA